MDFWKAYKILRTRHCPRVEEIAVEVEVSAHTVRAWDMTSGKKHPRHARNPGYFNRRRLAKLAERKGAKEQVVSALRPDPERSANA